MTHRRGMIGMATIAVVLAAPAIGATDEVHDFSRYKVITDRAPFCTATGAAAAAQPSFAARYVFVGVVSTTEDNRPLAIIEDKERNNRIYFKAEGETIDSTKVVKVEQSPAKLVLQQGLEVATLLYQARGGNLPPAAAPAPGTFTRAQPVQRRIPFRRGGNE